MIGILVVEDCENDRMLIRRALSKGVQLFQVFEAEDISKALAYLEGTGEFSDRLLHPLPKLIVCDLHFPTESGFDLIEKINARPSLKRFSVALMSGAFSPEMRRIACEKGACACIDKGDLVYNPGPFLATIEHCLHEVLARS